MYDGVVLVPLKALGSHDYVVYSSDSKRGPFYNKVGERITEKSHPVTFNQKKIFDPARDHKGEIRYRDGKTFSIEIAENVHISHKAGVFNINTFYYGFSEEVLFSSENDKNWLAVIAVVEEKPLSKHIFRDFISRFNSLEKAYRKDADAYYSFKGDCLLILNDLKKIARDRLFIKFYSDWDREHDRFYSNLNIFISRFKRDVDYGEGLSLIKAIKNFLNSKTIDELVFTVSYYPCHPDELLKALEDSTLSYLRFRSDSYEQLGDSVKLSLQTKTYLARKDGHPVQLAEHSAHLAIVPVKLDVCLRLTQIIDKTNRFEQGSLNPLLAKFQGQSTIITQLIKRGLSKSRAEHLVRGRSNYYDNLKGEAFLAFFADNISNFDALYQVELAAIKALQKTFEHAVQNASEDPAVKESIAESLKKTQDKIFSEIFENLKQDRKYYNDHVTKH